MISFPGSWKEATMHPFGKRSVHDKLPFLLFRLCSPLCSEGGARQREQKGNSGKEREKRFVLEIPSIVDGFSKLWPIFFSFPYNSIKNLTNILFIYFGNLFGEYSIICRIHRSQQVYRGAREVLPPPKIVRLEAIVIVSQ